MLGKMKTAILLSGGMDSVAIAYWLKPECAITINYGQKPALGEIRASASVCKNLNIEHHVIEFDISSLGRGDLSFNSNSTLVPEYATEWWPFRNQMLITIAAMKAISINVGRLYIGTLKSDSFFYDNTQEFVNKMNQLLKLQEGQIELHAPAIELDALELLRESKIPLSVLRWSHSCHKSNYACGECRGCQKHNSTMNEFAT